MLTLATTRTAVAAVFGELTSTAQQSAKPVLQPLSLAEPDFTTQPAADDSQKEAEGKWPWWLWITVVVGSAVIVLVFMSVCVCLCCRPHRRRRQRHCKAMPENNADSDDPASHSGGVLLRRLDSSSANGLRNLVSVFSWGSDFDPAPDESKAVSPNPSPRGSQVSFTDHFYVNPDSLEIEGRDVSSPEQPPPRPPRKNEVNHYLNVSRR